MTNLQAAREVDRLIDIENEIWGNNGFRSGRDVEKNKESYQRQVKEAIKEKVAQEVVDQLEDENYHSMVEALHDLHLIQK